MYPSRSTSASQSRGKADGLQWPLLFQVALCLIPSMTLLGMGNYSLAATTFYVLFGIVLVGALIRQKPVDVTVLVMGCLPALMLLRDFFFYSSVEGFLGLAVFIWAIYAQEDFKWLFSSRVVQGLLAFVVVYWLASFARTGDYSENLRAFELAFSAMGIRLLSKHRKYLATALCGIAISGFSIGLALAGQGDRLGMVRNDDTRLGNPVTFGVPMALILILCLAERGRWMTLDVSAFRRFSITAVAGVFLLLSTSRGSWTVAAACIVTMLFFAPRRLEIVRLLVIGTVAVSIWAHFADTSTLEKYIYKTFYSEEEWSSVNARVAQWQSFPVAFSDAPIIGFGPGSGKGVSQRYSGHNLIWHSLYMQIGIECGSVGLVLLALLLGALVLNGFRHLRVHGEIAPLLGVIGFMTIAVSIPAVDGVCGLLLGFSLAGGSSASRFRIVRTVMTRTVPARALKVVDA
jgi:O-antigen ligase